MVVTVNPHLGLTASRMTVIAGIEQLAQASRAKIQDVRVDYPGRPIVLVGFNTGAALACQVCTISSLYSGFQRAFLNGKKLIIGVGSQTDAI